MPFMMRAKGSRARPQRGGLPGARRRVSPTEVEGAPGVGARAAWERGRLCRQRSCMDSPIGEVRADLLMTGKQFVNGL